MNKPLVFSLALLAASALPLAGCATEEAPSDFGDSVRNMVSQQIYDRHAAENPAAEPPLGLDGTAAAAALKAYREQAGTKPAQPMTVEIPIGVSTSH